MFSRRDGYSRRKHTNTRTRNESITFQWSFFSADQRPTTSPTFSLTRMYRRKRETRTLTCSPCSNKTRRKARGKRSARGAGGSKAELRVGIGRRDVSGNIQPAVHSARHPL